MPARPLSPHLSVYRFMYTMVLSITHRITGLLLTGGFMVLAWWLYSVASGPAAYSRVHALLSNGLFKLLLAGWIAAFAYHLCNGIRHLSWDIGFGLERSEARRSAVVTVIAAVLIFGAIAWLAFGAGARS